MTGLSFNGTHLVGDFGDVSAAVTVFRSLLAASACQQGTGEVVDLGAVIVEVIFARYLGAAGLEDTC